MAKKKPKPKPQYVNPNLLGALHKMEMRLTCAVKGHVFGEARVIGTELDNQGVDVGVERECLTCGQYEVCWFDIHKRKARRAMRRFLDGK